jgi:Na+/H+-translocating membrane pyrophosphatase
VREARERADSTKGATPAHVHAPPRSPPQRFPGLLTVCMPIVVGITFRAIGSVTDRPLLGAEVLLSFLMFATVSGILMALFLDNVGGAWDNAKKYIELGNFGGKGSDAHKAAVTGDTVGDPCKDTAGPSLHVVIKLLSTCILVLGPLFVPRIGTAAATHA